VIKAMANTSTHTWTSAWMSAVGQRRLMLEMEPAANRK
jgi:hypothetical protein